MEGGSEGGAEKAAPLQLRDIYQHYIGISIDFFFFFIPPFNKRTEVDRLTHFTGHTVSVWKCIAGP